MAVMIEKPNAPACERNKAPILGLLKQELRAARQVLEIGSGTGQHAVHFAAALSHVRWHTSDLKANHPGIQAWIDWAGLDNLLAPIALDVHCSQHWPDGPFDAVFTANTCHIMDWGGVELMFAGAQRLLPPGGPLLVYGPFNRHGQFTSPGNRDLDRWARTTFPGGGIRDIEAVDGLAGRSGFESMADHEMPANNRLLVFKKARE